MKKIIIVMQIIRANVLHIIDLLYSTQTYTTCIFPSTSKHGVYRSWVIGGRLFSSGKP